MAVMTGDASTRCIWKTCDIARADVFDYIELFRNRTRQHSHLVGLNFEAFERAAV